METKHIEEFKKEITEDFNDKDNTYDFSDRLNVSIHKILDNHVTGEEFKNILIQLSTFPQEDFRTLDSGLYDGIIERDGFDRLCRVLLYCLIEQELWNDDEFNKLQNIEIVNGIKLK